MDFVAYRFTTGDSDMVKKLFDGTSYVYGFEKSVKDVEHFHVVMLCPGTEQMKIKKRMQRMDVVCPHWSKKNYKNGLLPAISYTVKSGDIFVSDEQMQLHVDVAPVWVFGKSEGQGIIQTDPKPTKGRDWQLTYSNLVFQAVSYHQSTGLVADVSLKAVVHEMIEKTKWRPSYHMVKNGVPEFYSDDFAFRIGKRSRNTMDWWTPRI